MGIARDLLEAARRTGMSRPAVVVFGALLAGDLVFLALHALHIYANAHHVESLSAFTDRRFSIEQDRGYSERFEYAKTLLCMLALGAIYVRTRQTVHLALSLIYSIILLDNAARLHERAGLAMTHLLAPAEALFRSAPRAFGEMVFYLAIGAVMTGGLIWSFRRTAAAYRAGAGLCVLLIGVLAGFGFGIDFIHAASKELLHDDTAVMGFVEDGGELIVLSANCALACALYAQMRASGHPLERPHLARRQA